MSESPDTAERSGGWLPSPTGGSLAGVIWIPLLMALIALVHTLPVLTDFDHWGIMDWDQHFFYHAVPRETILKYHQAPLWNPYYCGGLPLFANPQSRILAPTYPLVLFFGAVRGLKLEIMVSLVIGLWGAYALARHLRLPRSGALLAACVSQLSTVYTCGLAAGMTHFLALAYLPWTLLFFFRSFGDRRWSIPAGLFLAIGYFAGGHYIVPIALLFMVLYALCALPSHGLGKPLVILVLTTLFSLGFGAVKILPSAQLMRAHPRRITDESGYSLCGLTKMMLDRDQKMLQDEGLERGPGFLRGVSYEMDENGMYLGFPVLLLAVVGAATHWRRRWPWLVCLVMFLWLSFGHRVPISIWDWLHRLPIFDNMRVAMRFRIIVLLCAGIFAGLGLSVLVDLFHRRVRSKTWTSLLCVVVVGALVTDYVLVSRPIFAEAFPFAPDVMLKDLERKPDFEQINRLPVYDRNGFVEHLSWFDIPPIGEIPVDCSYSALLPAFLSNLGTVWAYEVIPVPWNASYRGREDYRGEAFVEGMTGKARIQTWSPNRLEVSVAVRQEDELVLNQNYDPHWVATGGDSPVRESRQGLLSVAVSPDTKVVTFTYRSRAFDVGCAISLLTVLGSIVFLLWTRRTAASNPEPAPVHLNAQAPDPGRRGSPRD